MEPPKRPLYTGFCVFTGYRHVNARCAFDHAQRPLAADDTCLLCLEAVNPDVPDDPLRRMCGVCCDCTSALHLTCQLPGIRKDENRCYGCRKHIEFVATPVEKEKGEEEPVANTAELVEEDGEVSESDGESDESGSDSEEEEGPEYPSRRVARIFFTFYPSSASRFLFFREIRNTEDSVDGWLITHRPKFEDFLDSLQWHSLDAKHLKYYALKRFFVRHPWFMVIGIVTILLRFLFVCWTCVMTVLIVAVILHPPKSTPNSHN